jgi:hypothetical protein
VCLNNSTFLQLIQGDTLLEEDGVSYVTRVMEESAWQAGRPGSTSRPWHSIREEPRSKQMPLGERALTKGAPGPPGYLIMGEECLVLLEYITVLLMAGSGE